MAPYIIFNSRHFLDEVKKFWLRTKRNRLRIETNKAEKRILLNYKLHPMVHLRNLLEKIHKV